jgi:fluoroquinolone resistance protein
MTDLTDTQSEYISLTFTGLNWSRRDVTVKEFDGCTFKECDFSETVFSKCKFIDCQFFQCNLSLAKITLSKFSDVAFDECKMVGMDWTKAAWSSLALASPIKFHKCILNDSSFFGLNLEELAMEECKAHDVDFRECNLTEANFSYTDFAHSLFKKTNLARANFAEAINYDIDIYVNEIKGAKFCRYEAARLLEGLGIELVD